MYNSVPLVILSTCTYPSSLPQPPASQQIPHDDIHYSNGKGLLLKPLHEFVKAQTFTNGEIAERR